MITATVHGNDTVVAWAEEWVGLLNEREIDRRIAVNQKHHAEFGRLLYPEGGQYARFSIDAPGSKYTRIVMDVDGSRSVHAFFDHNTGDVFKPAGWKTPAKGARFNLLDSASRDRMFTVMDFTGGYLYHGRG